MDISQESDPKSQDEILVRSSFGKNFECYVRERYLKKISVVSSGHTEREVQLRTFASYRSLELALLFSIYTNKEFKALESLDTYSYMVSGFFASVQGEEIAGKIVVAKVRNSQRMNDPLFGSSVAENVRRNHPVVKFSGNCLQ